MPLTPYDDIVEISRRCDVFRTALADVDDDVKMDPSKRYLMLCQVSGERPNPIFLRFTQRTAGSCLDLHHSYLGQRGLLLILLTIPLCPWLKHIDLREERLTTTLVQLLCEALWDLPCVEKIEVSGNPFGSLGVGKLLTLALRNHSIMECCIDGIQCVGALRRRLQMACERNAQGAFQVVMKEEKEEKKKKKEREEKEHLGHGKAPLPGVWSAAPDVVFSAPCAKSENVKDWLGYEK